MRVVVIGGGIVGVTAALSLAERDVDVSVLERGSVAGEASGLNAGIIGGGGWGADPDVDVALKMGSRDRFVDLVERGHDIGLDLAGTLVLIRTPQEWEWAAAAVSLDRTAGRQLELLSSSELVELEPAADPELLGAIFDPVGARAEPVAATTAFAAEARASGAAIETGCTVSGLRPVANGWEVQFEGRARPFGADAVIIAAGAWCAELGAMVEVDIPIVAVRGQMWASEPRRPMLRHAIAATESALAWSDEEQSDGAPPELTHRHNRRLTRHLYGRQRPNGEIVFGGDRILSSNPTPDVEGIRINHDHVAELLPQIAQLAPVRTWAGLMPFSLDGKPLIGPVPGHDGLFLAGGLASSGFGRGPMAGQLVADLVLKADPGVDLNPLALDGRVRALE